MKLIFPKKLKLAENCGSGPYIPGGLLLQWHITERCNLRCDHCYQDVYGGEELSFDQQLQVVDQFKNLLAKWRRISGRDKMRGHITITGGEPFVRNDFLDLLEVFEKNKNEFSFAILTNGSFIDASMAKRLRKLNPSFVQVSIEGGRDTHDEIRGAGSYDETVSAIRFMVKEKIRTLISFTAHSGNYKEFPEVARLGRKIKVDRVWSDRLIPRGSASELENQVLSPDETKEFFEMMETARSENDRVWFNRTEIAINRALQFLVGHGEPYHCTAGDTLITVQPNGDLFPCRRMPIPVGNLMKTPLEQLYYQSELFQDLRDKNKTSEGCEKCFYSGVCRGGLKCLSYALYQDPFIKDPGCFQDEESPRSVQSI